MCGAIEVEIEVEIEIEEGLRRWLFYDAFVMR